MPTLLEKRAPTLRERMDDPACNLTKLHNTYTHFHTVNRFVAGWRRVYTHFLRPHLTGQPATLLDVGCGGGDVARRLAGWAQRDGVELHITAIDPDERALAYARSRPHPNITFHQAHSADLVKAGERYDVVVSNHLLHHLGNAEVNALCRDSQQLAKRLVIHNDIRRSDLAYAGFTLTKLFFHNSFITEDGLLSIRRSFVPEELEAVTPEGWQVERLFPYRNLLIYRA